MAGEPVEDVAHRRLARLQTVHARDDRPGNDSAQPGDIGQRLVHGHDHHVAGAGADDFDKRTRLNPRPDSSSVGVEGTDGHRDPGRQAHLLGDLGRQLAGLLIGRNGPVGVSSADLDQVRVEAGQELLAGESAPLVVVHRLVTRRADAARQSCADRDAR